MNKGENSMTVVCEVQSAGLREYIGVIVFYENGIPVDNIKCSTIRHSRHEALKDAWRLREEIHK